MILRRHSLGYQPDSGRLFQLFSKEPWAVFFDSGGLGVYDIISSRPSQTLITRGELTEIVSQGKARVSREAPFALLNFALGSKVEVDSALPFFGGAMGYFGYDLARRFERLPDWRHEADPFPDMAMGIYDWCLVTDHQRGLTQLVGLEERMDQDRWRELVALLDRAGSINRREPAEFRVMSPLAASPDWMDYQRAFSRVQAYLRDGDCYQVNLARRFWVRVQGDPWRAYQCLRANSPAPFGFYLNLPEGQLLCNSPERFLTLRGGVVTTSPVKGTRPRHAHKERDAAEARDLVASAKDRAENLMIVDLLRNDLGRSCEYGSIRVGSMFRLESFATVHHLVSDISGRLRTGEDALGLLQNCFPGGSITGAPKLRAMEIIDELEPCRRGPYCGSAAYLGFDGNMDSNILIRTMMHRLGRAWFWGGGGIVADSAAEAEFRETEHKVKAFTGLLRN